MTANLKQEQDAANTEHLQTFDPSMMEQLAALKAKLEGERVESTVLERDTRQEWFEAACARADEIIAQFLLVLAESMKVPPEQRDWEFVMRLGPEEVSSEVDLAQTAARQKARPSVTGQEVVCETLELRESAITARRVAAFLSEAGIRYKIEKSCVHHARDYRMWALAR